MKFIDVCAGIGGFRMGLEKHGHECVYTIEYDKKAEIAHKAIWGDEPEKSWFDDMRKLDYSNLPDFDILCGGFPCAKFSIAGDRKGFESDDPRATVFFELMKIAEIKKPSYLFFENVKGLLNHDEGNSFKTILTKMDELGYDAEWQLINAQNHGGYAIRERLFIIGHLRGSGERKQVFPIEGTKPTYDTKTQVFQYRRGHFRVFNGYFPTLTASMGTGGNNVPLVKDGDKLRKITPRECFRLQGIPNEYIDRLINSGLNDSSLYERAGRTVFVPIIEKISKKIK